MPTFKQVLTVSGVTIVTAGIGFCLYFDYKRRNDTAFRRKLQNDRKKAAKAAKIGSDAESAEAIGMLKMAVDAVNAEILPEGIEARENYFLEQVSVGEMLAQRLPQGAVPAAIAFFKAYKVYPLPQDLIMMYQRTIPQEVFVLVMEMLKIDVRNSTSKRLSSQPVIEEIFTSGPSQPTSMAKPSSGKSETSSSRSTAPSELDSITARSFVIVDTDLQGATRATPVSLTESISEVKQPSEPEEINSPDEQSTRQDAAESMAHAGEANVILPEIVPAEKVAEEAISQSKDGTV